MFDGNAGSPQLGKGFGEGKILEHVMHRSSILNSCSSFFKCTGRVYISNFSDISDFLKDTEEGFFPLDMTDSIASQALPSLTVNNAWRQVFARCQKGAAFSRRAGRWIWNPRLKKGCDTRFFKSGSDFFRQRLINQYRTVDDRAGYYLEHAYYYGLEGQIEFLTGTSPIFTGTSGTSGFGLDSSFPEVTVEEAKGFL